MKRIRKIFTAVIIACMLCPCISMVALAAYAELHFSDPQTTVGAEVEVEATFSCPAEAIRSVDATLTYDTAMLRYVEGSQAREENGVITLSGAGDGTATTVKITLKFQALAEGTTVIQVSSASGETVNGNPVEVVNSGSSTIVIGPGDESLINPEDNAGTSANGPQVNVNGQTYTICNDISDIIVPPGFEKTEMQYEGTACTVVTQSISGTIAMYLESADGEQDFFLYDPETGVFSSFQQVEISSERYLIFLQNDGTLTIPEGYEETTLTINGKEFPAWQNTVSTDYYLVYGLNSDGTKGLYLYDTIDGTYQRYLTASAPVGNTEDETDGMLGGLLGFVRDHLMFCVLAAGVIFFLLLITLIVVGVKLRHRNYELDDLYDEYGIDMEEEEDERPTKVKKKQEPEKKQKAKKAKKNEDDFYDFEDEDDEYDDEYDEPNEYDDDKDYLEDGDDFDDYDDDYGMSMTSLRELHGLDDSDELDDVDDSDEMEDLDAMLQARVREPQRRAAPESTQKRRSDEKDGFQVDFVDLD